MLHARLGIYVFSYNRGIYLRNCLRSIVALEISCRVFIIDDGSDDPDTQAVISEYHSKFPSITPRLVEVDKNYGGLYANMNYALKHASHEQLDYALFLQDDTQLVRPLTDFDFANFDRFFDSNPNAIELHVFFEKKIHINRHQHNEVDGSGAALFRTPAHKGHRGFTDIGLFHVKRTRTILGDFRQDEFENDEACLKMGIRVGFYQFPIGHWLPCPRVVRGRKPSFLLVLSDKLSNAGVYAIKLLTDDDLTKLCAITFPCISPKYAEDWLSTEKDVPHTPWTYGGFSNLIGRGGVAKICGILLAAAFVVTRRAQKLLGGR